MVAFIFVKSMSHLGDPVFLTIRISCTVTYNQSTKSMTIFAALSSNMEYAIFVISADSNEQETHNNIIYYLLRVAYIWLRLSIISNCWGPPTDGRPPPNTEMPINRATIKRPSIGLQFNIFGLQ